MICSQACVGSWLASGLHALIICHACINHEYILTSLSKRPDALVALFVVIRLLEQEVRSKLFVLIASKVGLNDASSRESKTAQSVDGI